MKVPSPKLTFWGADLRRQIVRGLGVTIGHLAKNLFRQSEMPTVQFRGDQTGGGAPPQPPSPHGPRGRHAEVRRLCVRPTACPANCIHIIAEESRRSLERKEAPRLRNRPPALCLLRAVRGGLSRGRHPHGHRRGDDRGHPARRFPIVGLDFLMHGEGNGSGAKIAPRRSRSRSRVSRSCRPRPRRRNSGVGRRRWSCRSFLSGMGNPARGEFVRRRRNSGLKCGAGSGIARSNCEPDGGSSI